MEIQAGLLGQPVKEVFRSLKLKTELMCLRELKRAEVYMTIDGTLHVFVDQRNPIMRVMPENGGDYFIDEDGVVMRRRNLYTSAIAHCRWQCEYQPAMLNGVSVLDTTIKNSILKDIYHTGNYINDDNFWSAQIDQIYVDNNDEIDLIPRVGNQLIHLGTAENYEGKLRNLEAFMIRCCLKLDGINIQ